MARAFAEIAFTPGVRALQERNGSARSYDRMLTPEAPPANRIGPEEAAFAAARDGFYMSTVSETGWPYVQFRGGPRGFLRTIDEETFAFADFRGNRQHVSEGNIAANDRVALILMDYPNRRRLKVLGRAQVSEDPELIEKLKVPGGRGLPERAVLIKVEALDWNCPSHIPQRFTLEELEPALAPLRDELVALREENARLKGA